MFIAKDYEMHLDAPACEPGAEYWNATATEQVSKGAGVIVVSVDRMVLTVKPAR